MELTALITRFWTLHRDAPFSAAETQLYFLLLSEAVRLRQNPFPMPTQTLAQTLNIHRRFLSQRRLKLQNKGLIKFSEGKNKSYPSVYEILGFSVTSEQHWNSKSTNLISVLPQSNTETESLGLTALSVLPQSNTDKKTSSKTNFSVTSEQHWNPKSTKTTRKSPNSAKKTSSPLIPPSRIVDTTYNPPIIPPCENIEKGCGEKLADDTDLSDDYRAFLDWLPTAAPYVAKNIRPLTQTEFHRLKARFGSRTVSRCILNIENRRDLRKKYVSLYRTLINWCKNETSKTR